MPKSKQTPYIPYKHIGLVIILVLFGILQWVFSSETVSQDQVQNEVPLANELPANEKVALNIEKIKTSVEVTSHLPEATPAVVDTIEEASQKTEDKVIVKDGDTLSVLFDTYDLGQTTMRMILSADESLLALETLQPGQILYFRYHEDTQKLQEMELYKHAGHRIIYRRIADDAFNYETIIKEGEWRNETLSGSIEGIFYLSAQRAGLTETETATVTHIFQDQLDFSRAIRKGDQFQIVRSVQFIDDKPTGQTRIESARIQRRAFEHTAFLFDDGRYYDKEGKSLARAFTRTPLSKSYRISSRFNPRRVHPVTGRIGPHNGVDFATPMRTKVLSTGDGVVVRVGNHPFAGKYIDIKHGGQYKTRYLHLDKIYVHRGESISRGQTIALSGNSGRSTGPHLHFELHIHGRPVDPMKAKIPISREVPKENKTAFNQRVLEQTQLLDSSKESNVIIGYHR